MDTSYHGALPLTSVPTSIGNGGGDAFMNSLIENISKPLSPELIESATTPVAGSHTSQVPSSFTTPIQPFQGAPLDERQVVGKHNAKMQGIGNTVTAVANTLGGLVTAETQHKQNQVRDAATKVINAQQALDQAQQAHDEYTKSGDTQRAASMQAIIDQNTKVRDGVFSDPKLRKALVKGFDISYTDPQSNKTTEHAGVMEAIKNAKTIQEKRAAMQQYQQQQNQAVGKTVGAAYAQQQPRGLASNVVAQQKLQIEQTNRAASQVALKDYLTFKASMAHANATIGAAQIRAIGAGILQQTKFDQAQELQDQKLKNSVLMQNMRYRDALSEIAARGNQARQTARDVFSDRQSDPIMLGQKMQKSIKTYDDAIAKDAVTLQTLQAQRTALYMDNNNKPLPKPPGQDDVNASNQALQYVQQHLQNMKSSRDALMKNYETLRSTYGAAGEGGGSDATDSADNDTGDYSDPSNHLDAPGSDDQP